MNTYISTNILPKMSHGRAPFNPETGSTGTAPTNKWSPFFGTPEGYHEDVRADDQLSHETYNLPKAYEGKNKRLEDILDFMIRQEDEFYTRELLPWEYTDDIHIVWDVWKFNRTLADVVPEQGISRLVTQESERHTENLVRRGLAFQLEHGFMTTEYGRRNYALNLQQISDAVHTTCYFGVMHALFAGQNYYKEYRRKFARFVKGPRTLFRHERQMWACLQKDIKGVYIMDAEIKHHMKINGITPNVLVLPPKAGIYVSMVPPSETVYNERGPGAHEALTTDRTGITTFRGNKVFEAQSFDVDFQHDFIDLTSRPRMCGEYFVMPGTTAPHDIMKAVSREIDLMVDKQMQDRIPRFDGTNGVPGDEVLPGTGLLQNLISTNISAEPFIHIYSADKDDYVKITYSEANMHALNAENDTDGLGRITDTLKDALNKVVKKYHDIGKAKVAAAGTPKTKKEAAAKFVTVMTGPRYGDYDAGQRFANQGVGLNPARASEADIRGLSNDALVGQAATAYTLHFPRTAVGNGQSADNQNTVLARLRFMIRDLLDIAGEVNGLEANDATSRDVGSKLKRFDLDLHFLAYLAMADVDHHNYDILIMRPFQTYTMHSALMAKGGSELGNTYHGHHDFQLSDNVAVKTHFGNYTFYSKAVVKRPRNYTIIPDCFAQGYISGEGHTFFRPQNGEGDNDVGDLGRAIQEGSLGSADCRQSLIAWKIPRGDGEKLADAIDITGRFAGVHRDYEQGDGSHFSGAAALGCLESIEELDQNRSDDAYLHQVQQVNTVCFRGSQYTNGVFTHSGKGHWGTPYSGVLPVRDGALMYMDPSKEPKKGDAIV